MKVTPLLGLAVSLAACHATPRETPAGARTAISPASLEEPLDLRKAPCIGPPNATSFAVYLHGMDAASPSEQEMTNRSVLVALAQARSLRVALPRAEMECPTQPGSICWGWSFDDVELEGATSIVRAAAEKCFGDRPATIIGFSNGGYLLTNLLRTCSLKDKLPRATHVITVGAGMMKGPLGSKPESLVGCGDMTMLVGDKDEFNFDPTGNLLQNLRSRNAAVREIRFDGGHLLHRAALDDALSAIAR